MEFIKIPGIAVGAERSISRLKIRTGTVSALAENVSRHTIEPTKNISSVRYGKIWIQNQLSQGPETRVTLRSVKRSTGNPENE